MKKSFPALCHFLCFLRVLQAVACFWDAGEVHQVELYPALQRAGTHCLESPSSRESWMLCLHMLNPSAMSCLQQQLNSFLNRGFHFPPSKGWQVPATGFLCVKARSPSSSLNHRCSEITLD